MDMRPAPGEPPEESHALRRAQLALREKELQLQVVLDQMPASVWTVDRNLIIQASVGRGLAAFGLAPGQLVGTHLTQFLGTDDPTYQPIAAHVQALGGAASSYAIDFRGRPFEVRIEPLRDGSGEVVGAVGLALDISERRAAEAEMRESEERYRSVVESALDVVLTIDEGSRILFANAASERVFGWKPEELVGRSITTLMATSVGAGHVESFERYLATGRPTMSWRAVEFPGITRSGAEIPLEISFSESVRDGRRTFTGIIRDVSDRRVADNLRSALYRVAETSSGAHDMTKLYGAIRRIVDKLMEADGFLVAVKDGGAREMRVAYWAHPHGAPAPAVGAGSPAERVLESGEAVLLRRENAAPDDLALLPPATLDWLAVPLRSGDHRLGVLSVTNSSPQGRYRDADREVLTFVSRHLASALEKRQAELALALWKARYEAATLASRQVLYDHDQKTDRITWGGDTTGVLGARPSDLPTTIAGWAARIHDEDRPDFLVEASRKRGPGEPYHLEYRMTRPDGIVVHLRDDGSDLYDDDGFVRSVGFLVDVTERKRLEEQLRQSQKMEAVGRLAGGVAHDFNNVLTTILGYSDLLAASALDVELRQHVEEIRRAGERAAALTSQLLAFSRKQMLAPRVLDLNALVLDLEKMLRRVIGEDVELVTRLAPALGRVKADPSQIEHVVMNLVLNARDAMPHGGRLTLETANILLDGEPAGRTGPHVVLSVLDTGTGMDAATRSRLFEPFFTTKERGKGTGLGLATSYGIVKQSGGEISVESAPGKGTAIRVMLPMVDEEPERPTSGGFAAIKIGGSETVLVVEDEQSVASLTRKVLLANGYVVLQADGGDAALKAAARHAGTIHLLLTDVVMPGLSGRELAERLRRARPEVKVLYMSGYTDDAMMRHGLHETDAQFLQKPFSLDALLARVRETLDRRSRSPSSMS
jgi:PAS domain S-box-containing protein